MEIKAYACYSCDEAIRLNSSSGGVFSVLAKYVLSKSGAVYGVAMSKECYSAGIIRAASEEGLARLRGSKYFQADVGNSYNEAKADLETGRMVLFSGTGCQINGLKSFLKAANVCQENLICVDVICHGAPSPALWREYVMYQEKRHHGKLKDIYFRCKDSGWADFGMKEYLENALGGGDKEIYISKDRDAFMQMFLRDFCLRPSCYECAAKRVKKSDISIGDFWGIEKAVPEMNDGRGISLVLARTEKGREIFEKIREGLKIKEVSYEDGVRCNSAEYRPVMRPPQRDAFFTDMNSLSFEKMMKKYASPAKIPFKSRLKGRIKSALAMAVKILRGRQKKDLIKHGGGGSG